MADHWAVLLDREKTRMLGNLAVALGVLFTGTAPVPPAEGNLEPGSAASVLTVPAPARERMLSVVVALKKPGALAPAEPITASVDAGGAKLQKVLHLGDPDVS